MTELSTMDNFIFSIYRVNIENIRKIKGRVEKLDEKTIYRVSIDRCLQGENRGRQEELWETAFRECSDLDGLQALEAEDVLNVRRKIARRSRPPKMDIPEHAVDRSSEKGKQTRTGIIQEKLLTIPRN